MRALTSCSVLVLAMLVGGCKSKSDEASQPPVAIGVAAGEAAAASAEIGNGRTLAGAAFSLPLPEGWQANRERKSASSDDGDEVTTATRETTPEAFRKYAELRRSAAEQFGGDVEALKEETIAGTSAYSFRAKKLGKLGDAGDNPNVFGVVVRKHGDGRATAVAVTFFSAAHSVDELEKRGREVLKNLTMR